MLRISPLTQARVTTLSTPRTLSLEKSDRWVEFGEESGRWVEFSIPETTRCPDGTMIEFAWTLDIPPFLSILSQVRHPSHQFFESLRDFPQSSGMYICKYIWNMLLRNVTEDEM